MGKEINSLLSRKHITKPISQESLLNNASTGLPSNPNELNFKFNFLTNKRNSEKKPTSAKSVSENTTNKFVTSHHMYKNTKSGNSTCNNAVLNPNKIIENQHSSY